MSATRQSPWRSRRIVLLLASVAALVLTLTTLASAQVTDSGGSADGIGDGGNSGHALTVLGVTGTPQAAVGSVTWTNPKPPPGAPTDWTGVAKCIAIDEIADPVFTTVLRASIAGEITGGSALLAGFRGFRVTVYDRQGPPGVEDPWSDPDLAAQPQTSCNFDFPPTQTQGGFTIVPFDVCPPQIDEDNDGLTDHNENLFSTLLGNSDSDLDGISDGNEDSDDDGEDDEDEDDEEDDGCPDEDSDDDGEDDEDEDDEDEDDD
jgi:hypothetical protein